MPFRVQVLLDSINGFGSRLTTFRLEFPTQILKEVNTHTILSRNASSSRAIPVKTKLEYLYGNADKGIAPQFYRPMSVGKNRGGMQATETVDSVASDAFYNEWALLFDDVTKTVERMNALGVHKQEVNPLLEAFDWTRQVLSGTDWDNFFALRTHRDAKPAFRYLARAMYLAREKSTPKFLREQDWHLPFISEQDASRIRYEIKVLNKIPSFENGNIFDLCKRVILTDLDDYSGHSIRKEFDNDPATLMMCVCSAARCARVSLDSHKTRKKSTLQDDADTFATLVKDEPRHMSPLQHQNTPKFGRHGNHLHWLQFRKLISGENINHFAPSKETLAEWQDEVDPSVFCDKEEDWRIEVKE